MKSNAPGQLLGYSIQFPRALYHLLRCSPQDSVCVEYLGDVATLKGDGGLISEEDKSSIVGNPLTNKSIALWKTFYNWIRAVKEGYIEIDKTIFILYCNKSGSEGIVDKLNFASSKAEAGAVIKNIKQILYEIDSGHEIWEHYGYVVNANESIFIEIILKFELVVSDADAHDALREELVKKHISESQIDFILHNLSGWLLEYVIKKITAKENVIIKWSEFDHQFKALFNRSRTRELIDFTFQSPPVKEKIDNQIKSRPTYVKQLDLIEMNEEEILRSVSDFLRAEINRINWIDSEIIDEDIARDFEEKLKSFWRNRKERIRITERGLSEKEIGKLLYFDCMARVEMIGNMSPPNSTISGTYHALANLPVLGWHLNWKDILKK